MKPASRPKDGLMVREDKKKGVYVQDAKFIPVTSYDEIKASVDLGTNNRTIAATDMNATSSRAHTVVQIRFTQKTFNMETKKPEREL